MEEQVFKYVYQLFEQFGYWCIALVFATTLIMIPINYGIKALLKKTENQALIRLGKISIQLLVFVISGLCLTIFSLIFGIKIEFAFILTNLFPCAFLSMALWGVLKVLRDMGFKPLLSLILNSNAINKVLKAIPLDKSIKDAIFKKLCELVENTDGDDAEIVISKETEIVGVVEKMVEGFTSDVSTVAKQFSEALKIKYKKEEK